MRYSTLHSFLPLFAHPADSAESYTPFLCTASLPAAETLAPCARNLAHFWLDERLRPLVSNVDLRYSCVPGTMNPVYDDFIPTLRIPEN